MVQGRKRSRHFASTHLPPSPMCRPSGAGAELSHEELAGLINSIMAITNVAFFGLAGASLKLVSTAESRTRGS